MTTLGRVFACSIQPFTTSSVGSRRTSERAALASAIVVARFAAFRCASSGHESTPLASSRSAYSEPIPEIRYRSAWFVQRRSRSGLIPVPVAERRAAGRGTGLGEEVVRGLDPRVAELGAVDRARRPRDPRSSWSFSVRMGVSGHHATATASALRRSGHRQLAHDPRGKDAGAGSHLVEGDVLVGGVRVADIAGAEHHRRRRALADQEPHVGPVRHADERGTPAEDGLGRRGEAARQAMVGRDLGR